MSTTYMSLLFCISTLAGKTFL